MKSQNTTNKSNLEQTIESLSAESAYFQFQQIENVLTKDNKNFLRHASIKTYLSNYATKKIIYDAGKGWYSNLPTTFTLDTSPIKQTITDLEHSFPLLSFQVWSTAQINAYTQHLLSKHITFVSTESDAMGPIADVLRTKGYSAFINPGKADVEKHFRLDEKTVVLRPSISKEPVSENHAAPIEKILVDLVWESKHLKFIDEFEAQEVANNATAAGRIQMASLLGYAKRRLVDFSWLKTIDQVQKNKKFGDS
jgi:hypothetical protein